MLESAIGIAMVVYAVHWSIMVSKCLIHYFKLVIFKSVFRSVTIFLSLFLRRSEIGDQLVPFPNRKMVIFRGKNGSFTFCARDKYMSTRKLDLVIQN